ncbi:MAG: REP-associated tyrosine transposase [Gaiellaceae bacterium]|jgi:REP element-mobilizing transposase RayT|nr:REP-associated tyrosine transposase [Gaiellaceae bacterium]
MARQLRTLAPNGIYHVTARGIRKEAIFFDAVDWRRYLGILGDVVRDRGWRCRAYCLMPNHVHLVVQTPEPNLPDGMRDLSGRYAKRFNLRYGFCGHLFERRYWCDLVETDGRLLELERYVALNPVRAGLCLTPTEWRWSSYTAAIDADLAPRFLDVERSRELFGGSARLRQFIEGEQTERTGQTRP